MRKGQGAEVTAHVDVPPDRVYALVSDVTRMADWSPETIRCRWLDGAGGPAVGARFRGVNRRGLLRWRTTSRVVVADPPCEFGFVTDFFGTGRDMTLWRYCLEPAGDGGTQVTESFALVNDLPWFVRFGEQRLSRIKDRRADLVAGMEQTLGRLRAAAVTEVTGSTLD